MREFDRLKEISMSVVTLPDSPTIAPQQRLGKLASRPSAAFLAAEMKARQRLKIGELRAALVTAGFTSLDEHAEALGLCRSTTWAVLRANHKGSGLTAAIVTRMLSSPRLPTIARAKILEYVEEKVAGAYGGSKLQRRKFAARLAVHGTQPVASQADCAMSRSRKTA